MSPRLMLPKNKINTSVTLDQLLSCFRKAANDTGLLYREIEGNKREFVQGVGYKIPGLAIIENRSKALFWHYDEFVASYKFYRENIYPVENLEWGIRLNTRDVTDFLGADISPTFSSVVGIRDARLRRFVAKFYDIF